MADYALPAVVEKRVRYFDGQFLQDQDFIDEQNYQLDREHRHNRLLHGPGIAEGLAVTSAAPNQVTVAPGTAIDSDGRQLVLAQATTVDLPGADFNDKQGVELLISYLESAEDQQTGQGTQDFTRWLERPALTALAPGDTYSGTAPPVLLAKVTLDNAGRVAVDGAVRSYSGLRLPGSGADAATLSATSGGPVELAGSLTVDGSVGIGTAPAHPLHLAVGQALRIEAGSRTNDVTPYFSFGGNGTFSIDAPGVAGGRFVVMNSGNVGIGTNNPTARLEVDGGGGTSVDLVVNGRLRSANNDGGLWVASDRFIGGFETNKVGFYTGNAWQLTVLPNGDVGLGGNTAPGYPLHLPVGKALRIDAGSSASDSAAYFSFGGNGAFSIDAPGVAGGRFVVQNGGNVGVGTNNPTARLEVAGGGGGSVDLVVNGRLRSNNNDGGLWVASDRFVGGFDTNQIGFWNNGAWRLLVANDGTVGIGTPNTSGYTLCVNGRTWIQSHTYVSGSLNYWWGPDNQWKNIQNRADNYAGSYVTSGPSDIRLKDDLRPIGHALDLVRKLRGVRYRWGEVGIAHFTRDIESSVSAGPDATREQNQEVWAAERRRALDILAGDRLGLVAQDVEPVIPELVHEDADGYKRIRYQHLTALLTEAVKEQDAVVRALASEVAALRAGLSGQTAR